MKVYSTMPVCEFIVWLREAAIAQNAGHAVIDKIDMLRGVDEEEEEIEKIGGELYNAQEARDHYRENLEALLASINTELDPDHETKKLTAAIKQAREALE